MSFKAVRTEQMGTLTRVSVSLVGSTLTRMTSNELPIILNALRTAAVTDVTQHVGFTYTFPFRLAQGRGFPYVFPFDLRRKTTLMTLK